MPEQFEQLFATLREAIGAEHVLTDGDLGAWEQDWRQRERGRALAVLRPGSTAQVAACVRACAAAGVAIVTQGGNTGLVVGSTPDASGRQVVLSTARLAAVRAIDTDNMTMTLEAGCVLQNVQQAAEKAGALFPLSMAAEGSCTIGGCLAANAGGTQVLRYGNARELCLGLEVVTPQGDIWDGLSGLRKDNTGYSLRDLFIGSEGTLGVITAACVKLHPQPAAQLTAWAAVPSAQAAVQLLALARRRLAASLTGFEVMGQAALGLVARHFPQQRVPLWDETPWCVLLENSDAEGEEHARAQLESALEEALEAGIVTDAIVAESLAQAAALWHVRESIPLAQAEEGANLKHDVSVPISRIPEFVEKADAALRAAFPTLRLVNFGHWGDGNLHYNAQAPEGEANAAAFIATHEERIASIIYDEVARCGGSISAEHGVGSLKAGILPRYKSPVALQLMRAIKRALDPQGIMNPGRVLATHEA